MLNYIKIFKHDQNIVKERFAIPNTQEYMFAKRISYLIPFSYKVVVFYIFRFLYKMTDNIYWLELSRNLNTIWLVVFKDKYLWKYNKIFFNRDKAIEYEHLIYYKNKILKGGV